MRKSILAASIAALTIGTISVASATGIPTGSNYSGAGGTLAASSASISGTQSNGINSGNGYQQSGAIANNTTSASATVTPITNGVAVQTTTSSVGTTQAWSFGNGSGTSDSLALQGGIANANAKGRTNDYDSHDQYNHDSSTGGSGGDFAHGEFNADASGKGKAFGTFNGSTGGSTGIPQPTVNNPCVARGGTSNCGIGNGLGGGNGTPNEGLPR